MKKFLLSIILPAIALAAFNTHAGTLIGGGALTIACTVYQQGAETYSTNSTHTGKSTNYTASASEGVTSASFKNADLLNLLAFSFGMTFAKTDTLAVDQFANVYVVDKTGSNVVLAVPNNVLSLVFYPSVIKYSYQNSTTISETGSKTIPVTSTYTDTTTETDTSILTLSYDDSSMITENPSTFTIVGLATYAKDSTATTKTNTASQNFSFATGTTGTGSGTFRGTNSVISAQTITGSSKQSAIGGL